MTKRNLSLALGLVVLLLSGCVKTREQLKADGAGDTEMRQQTAGQQRAEAEQNPYKEKAPPTAFRFEEYDEQMRTLNGRVDTIENRQAQMDAASAGEKQSVTLMAKAIDEKFLAYEEEMKKMAAQIAELKEEVARKGPSTNSTAGSSGGGEKSRGPYDQAEDLFGKKQWKEAIVEYQKYRDNNPKGKLYADATYKIGVCFQELKLKDEAKAFFDEVVAKSPNSKEAKKAAFRMKTLK